MIDRIIWVKNNQDVADVYGGMELSGGVYYVIDSDTALLRMQSDSHLHEHIFTTPAKALIGDGSSYFEDKFLAQRWLMGWQPQDTEGRPYFRQVITAPDWYYSPRSLDFYTAKYGSLYNRQHIPDVSNSVSGAAIDAMQDIGDAWLDFYDLSNTLMTKGAEESAEAFQARLTSDCYKTVMNFEPLFDYDVMGAKIQFRNVPDDRAYFWAVLAPDIPAEWGGNVVFMGGGMNIAFQDNRDTFVCDGKSVARVYYDPVYHSGKMSVILLHNPGVQIGMQFILQFYS